MTEKVNYCRELEAVMKFSQERIGSVHADSGELSNANVYRQYTPSFVQSYGWFESSEAMFIAMEYVPHGDLQRYLSSPIAEDEARIITRQLAEGLHHMHMNGFTHRDLKPGNILVVSRGPDWLVQISDFGISRRLRPDQSTLGTMRRGTLGFIAPEMLGFITDRSHPYAVDVWSLGTVIFRMVTEKLFMTDFGLLQKYVASELQFPLEGLASLGTNKVFATIGSGSKDATTPDSNISLVYNSSQALEISAKDQAHRSSLSGHNFRKQSEYLLPPGRFLVDEAGIIHRTEYDMMWFDVYGEMKWPPERPRQRRKRPRSTASTQETLIMDEPIAHAEAYISKPREITTVIRVNPYVEGISNDENFTKNDTKSDGEEERDRFAMNSASGQRVIRFVAKQSDAEKHRIPPKYDLSRWDPGKTPLLFLYSVFDLVSIGTWFNDTIVSCRQYGQPIGDKDMEVLKDLAILLEKLDDSLSKVTKHSMHLQKADDKEMVQDLTNGAGGA
ncbi:calcium/calmodulin-dependent protein kinase type 1B [Colletotrichum asianum]